jgi:hypothetical protein
LAEKTPAALAAPGCFSTMPHMATLSEYKDIVASSNSQLDQLKEGL